MTTIYVPRLIETAEQAEALPIGTVAYRRLYDPELADIGHKGDDGWYMRRGHGSAWKDSDMIGDTALVPIEAEEEWEDDGRPVWNLGEGEATPADVDDYERRNGRRPSRRLVTPWEAV